MAHTGNHPYHLADPSPWPILGSIAALGTAGGLVMFMHDMTPWVLPLGLLLVIYTMYVWWRDVVNEATFQKVHTSVVQIGLRYGMTLFIASEVMFFFAWFWAFFNASLYPTDEMGGTWPPTSPEIGVEIFNAWGIPLVNTIILLSSGVTVTWAHHGLRKGDKQTLIRGLWLTVLLGAAFTALQAYEYLNAPFNFTGGIYGTTFFMATGFHGAHVIIGTVFLAVCLVRAYKDHFTPDHHFGFEAAAWYWHFVDVVWLFLFTFVYWWTMTQPGAVIAGH
ncbi:MAG: cytochrome c oxidase subunit 3 [Alphaproteobacteria bacterium]|nr:cytochrome c oxidase subunit 3 [Alphaproteobacteria bacterium]